MKRTVPLIIAALALAAAAAQAAVVARVVPAGIGTIQLPGIGRPVYPFPIETPHWPSLPANLAVRTLTPKVSLPHVAIPVAQPMEVPAAPVSLQHIVVPVHALAFEAKAVGDKQITPTIKKAVEAISSVEDTLGIEQKNKAPKIGELNFAFDGAKKEEAKDAVDARDEVDSWQERSRRAARRPRPVRNEEADLIEEIGVPLY